MSFFVVLLGCLSATVVGVYGHDTHSGDCPAFPPMKGFDWDRVSFFNCFKSSDVEA